MITRIRRPLQAVATKAKTVIESRFDRIIRNLLIGAIILLVLIFMERARALLFMAGFVAINAALVSYKRIMPSIPIEIEVLSMGIILSTMAYGLKAGLFLAVVGGIASFILSGNFSPFAFPMLGGYMMMAGLSFLLRGIDITWLGIIVTMANNILIFWAYHVLFGYDMAKNTMFSLSNILVNAILFMNVAPWLLKIMM